MGLDQNEDAIPVLKRCVAIKADHTGCWNSLGLANELSGRIPDAKSCYRKVIQIGGFDKESAKDVESAKIALAELENRYPSASESLGAGRMTRNLFAAVGFNLLLAAVLVAVAKVRRGKCNWDLAKTKRKLWWGILGICAVQVGGFIALFTTGQGIGILGAIQWPCIYWVALAVYRRRELKRLG